MEVSEKSSPANIVMRKYCSCGDQTKADHSSQVWISYTRCLCTHNYCLRSIIWSFVHTWTRYASIALKVKHTSENNSCRCCYFHFIIFECLLFAAIAFLYITITWKCLVLMWPQTKSRNRIFGFVRTYLNGLYVSVDCIVIGILCNFYVDILWLWCENVTTS